MASRTFAAPVLTACLLAVGFAGVPATANAESIERPAPGKVSEHDGARIHKRGRGPRIYVPIAPSYRYYDYPYYYSRGYYPLHISPGFVYYGYPYSYYRRHYSIHKRGPG